MAAERSKREAKSLASLQKVFFFLSAHEPQHASLRIFIEAISLHSVTSGYTDIVS